MNNYDNKNKRATEKASCNYIWGNNGDANDGKPFGEVVE